MKFLAWIALVALGLGATEVRITKDIAYVEFEKRGKHYRIERIGDTQNKLDGNFIRTSNPTPPFYIQPFIALKGVETIAELEILRYIQEPNVLLVDVRFPKWFAKETIPSAINIPYVYVEGDSTIRDKILFYLQGKKDKKGLWSFQNAPKIILFCNGPTCSQSSKAIRFLAKIGYPKEKMFYYRGGLQFWKLAGLNTEIK